MLLVLITDTFHAQLAVKFILQWKLCLVKLFLAIHIHVGYTPLYFISLNNHLPCKSLRFLHWWTFYLEASLFKLDAINLQLSMNLGWIFLHTSLPSSLVNPDSLTLIFTIKANVFLLVFCNGFSIIHVKILF